ncbi:hypothetical protein DPMN_144434 [Dreissena polymorpha]|uniref:Uncharacterized protein n=1 Tax=Dreissena polymorpha TaxID=45954 RepID=A0A9D4JP65_DREPO|nr:hypothetical protein DPMN_144434 [Dreissena polymorpha]
MLLSSVNFVVKGGKSKDKKTREISEEEKEEKEVTCEACARNKLVSVLDYSVVVRLYSGKS